LRRQKIALMVVSFCLLITALSIAPVWGSKGGGIQQYIITNTGTNQMYTSVNFQTGLNTNGSAILAGDELSITFTISANLATGADLKVSTDLSHSSLKQVYWELKGSYAGIDQNTFNPNQNFVNFKQQSGALQLVCYGAVPQTITQTTIGGTVLHNKASPTIIKLTGPNGEVLDQIVVDVIDSKILSYQSVYSNAETKFNSLGDVDPAYKSLYQSVLSGARLAAAQGFVDNAISTLQSLTSGLAPQSIGTPILATLFIPVVAVMAVIAVVAVFLFMKNRGKSSYYSLVIEDQIKDLEGLTMRAARIDRTLASNLEGVKERLQQIVGA
jgi:hypothetical protein